MIKLKEEELKTQHEEMSFQSQVIQFLVMSLPDNRNAVKEKLYNFNNDRLKIGIFDNLQKIEQFVNEQYRFRKHRTPIKTPSR